MSGPAPKPSPYQFDDWTYYWEGLPLRVWGECRGSRSRSNVLLPMTRVHGVSIAGLIPMTPRGIVQNNAISKVGFTISDERNRTDVLDRHYPFMRTLAQMPLLFECQPPAARSIVCGDALLVAQWDEENLLGAFFPRHSDGRKSIRRVMRRCLRAARKGGE